MWRTFKAIASMRRDIIQANSPFKANPEMLIEPLKALKVQSDDLQQTYCCCESAYHLLIKHKFNFDVRFARRKPLLYKKKR